MFDHNNSTDLVTTHGRRRLDSWKGDSGRERGLAFPYVPTLESTVKDLRNWFHKLTCLGNRSTAVRKPSRTRLSLEGLEARDMPSVTDMTQLATQFTPHSAPTVLYINFGGTGSSAVAGQVVAAYQSAPGGNRAADIQEITKQTSEIFAPFRLEVVPVDQAGWYDSSSLGNTTIFVGANAKDVDSVGNKAIQSFTPAAYVDAPGINKGYTHQPNSDPFDLAFVDPVGTVRPGLTQTQESDLLIAEQISHEAGHTFGLEHVSTGTDPDVMSYTSGLNQAFLDKTYSVTDLNYNPSKTPSTYHGGASFYAQWQEANGTIDTITTQDSFTYLQAVLGQSSDQSAVQRNANGLEQLFVIGADHAVWTQTQVTPGGALPDRGAAWADMPSNLKPARMRAGRSSCSLSAATTRFTTTSRPTSEAVSPVGTASAVTSPSSPSEPTPTAGSNSSGSAATINSTRTARPRRDRSLPTPAGA